MLMVFRRRFMGPRWPFLDEFQAERGLEHLRRVYSLVEGTYGSINMEPSLSRKASTKHRLGGKRGCSRRAVALKLIDRKKFSGTILEIIRLYCSFANRVDRIAISAVVLGYLRQERLVRLWVKNLTPGWRVDTQRAQNAVDGFKAFARMHVSFPDVVQVLPGRSRLAQPSSARLETGKGNRLIGECAQ